MPVPLRELNFLVPAHDPIWYPLRLQQQQEGSIKMQTPEGSISEQQQLVSDMKSTISDAEDMLQATADQVGDQVASLRARIQERLKGAQLRLSEAETALREKTRAAARATDNYVHESPWTAVGIAAGVGLLVGLIISRR